MTTKRSKSFDTPLVVIDDEECVCTSCANIFDISSLIFVKRVDDRYDDLFNDLPYVTSGLELLYNGTTHFTNDCAYLCPMCRTSSVLKDRRKTNR